MRLPSPFSWAKQKAPFVAMAAVRLELSRLQQDWRQRVFGAAGIRAELETSEGPCPRCGGPTEVQKPAQHKVVTLEHGDFIAHETIRVCKARCRQSSGALMIQRSDALALKAPPRKVFGYELEVHVGIERSLRHRRREEVRSDLARERGIELSTGSAGVLAQDTMPPARRSLSYGLFRILRQIKRQAQARIQ